MKKATLLIAMLSLFTLGAKAQWFDFSNNLSRVTGGANCGYIGYRLTSNGIDKQCAFVGAGASISILGLYVDYNRRWPSHRYQELTEDVEDHTAWGFNVGYQVPVLSWLYLTPMIGYCNETCGKTLAGSIAAENNNIVHKYEKENIYHHFNYGVGLTLVPCKWFEIGAFATGHSLYGNISFNFMN
jgi:hypothetical protein